MHVRVRKGGRGRGGLGTAPRRAKANHRPTLSIAPPMDNAAPPPPPPAHVVGADGGTIADGDARARADSRARERAVAGLAAVNNAAADFFAAPVGPAFPPGHVPNFNAAAAPLFDPGNMLAMMQAMPPLSVHVPMPPLPAPPQPPANTIAPAAAAANTTNNTRRPPAAAAAAAPTTQQRHQQAMRANAQTIEKAADKTYRGEYNRYVEFVKKEFKVTEEPFIIADAINRRKGKSATPTWPSI